MIWKWLSVCVRVWLLCLDSSWSTVHNVQHGGQTTNDPLELRWATVYLFFLLRWCVVVDASAFINTSSLYYCCAIMIMSKPFFFCLFCFHFSFFSFCKWKIKMLCPPSGLHHRQMADKMRFIHNSLRLCVCVCVWLLTQLKRLFLVRLIAQPKCQLRH